MNPLNLLISQNLVNLLNLWNLLNPGGAVRN
jgi:hypothetical protein